MLVLRKWGSMILLVLVSGTLSHLSAAGDPVLIPPDASRKGPMKLLLFIPSLANADSYRAMATAIQQRTTLRLAIGIANCNHFNVSLCDPEFELKGVLIDIINKMNKTADGALKVGDIFVGGQSVGGAIARHFADTQYDGTAGVLLFGTQYNGDDERMVPYIDYLGYPMNLAAYPRPILALTGELDMMPISHTALMVNRWAQLPASEQLKKLPVIIPGLSQSSYAPSFHVRQDLIPEVTPEEGLQSIAEVTGAWLDYIVSGSSESVPVLHKWTAVTKPIATPFIAAMELDKGWCADAQMRLPGVPNTTSVTVVHSPFTKLESCHTKYEVVDGDLRLTLCDYSAYTYGRRPPWKPSYAGAVDISCKMISEERIAQQLHRDLPDMKAPEIQNRCQEINKRAFNTAKGLFMEHNPKALERFEKQGKQVSFQKDTQTSAGPQWLIEGLGFKEEASQIEVSGVALITGVKSFIYPGNHYCKLLSPSVAVEVILTMGLTDRYQKRMAHAEHLIV